MTHQPGKTVLTEADAQLTKEMKRNQILRISIRERTLLYVCPECYSETQYVYTFAFIQAVKNNKLCDMCVQRSRRLERNEKQYHKELDALLTTLR